MSRAQARLFDRLAAGEQLYVYPPDSLTKLDGLVRDKGLTLDVGCGDGAIGQAFTGGRVAGFDISPRCAQLARGRGLLAMVANGEADLPFADGTFDTVYCVDVLHHLNRDWRRILGELARVLRPGGVMAIVEPDACNPFIRWTQAPGSPIRLAPFDNEPAIDPRELTAVLETLRFDIDCRPIDIHGEQVVRDVFPMWQRLAKAPFTLAMAWWFRRRPNKFAIIARKPVEPQ